MTDVRQVPGHFLRGMWNNIWEYPANGSLISVDEEYPALAPFYFSWEINYQPLNVMTFSREIYWLGPITAALYLIFVFLGPRLMENRKAFDLKVPLRCWNLFLAVFSFWGMLRVVPQLALIIQKTGFHESLCIPPVWDYGSGAAGLWTMLFVYSKYFELIDTGFIILRKKPLTFLHWYHHATVLLYSWDSFIIEQPPGLYFCAMNYTVHAIMYFYYYLAAFGRPPKWGVMVTVLQITQMIFGVVLTLIALHHSLKYPFLWYTSKETALTPFKVPGCYLSSGNLIGGLAMYSTYFYLFADFFWSRYVPRTATKEKKLK